MYIKLSGAIINYRIIGEGEPLIMLHGNGESMEIFNEAVEELKSKYQVILIDTRGHGGSIMTDSRDFHYQDMASDLAEFIDALGLRNVNLYGFSDGGIVALMYAINCYTNINHLILSGVNITTGGLKFSFHLLLWLKFIFTGSNLSGLMLKEPKINPVLLENIRTNVLLVYGESDIIKKREIATINAKIPVSSLVFVPKENHGSYVVNSKKIALIIDDFIEEN